jgi:hypothetical protein
MEQEVLVVDLLGMDSDEHDLVGTTAGVLDHGLEAAGANPLGNEQVVHGVDARSSWQAADLDAIDAVLEVEDRVLAPGCRVEEEVVAAEIAPHLVAHAPGKAIVIGAALERIVARAACQIVDTVAAEQAVVALATNESIVASLSEHGIGTRAARQQIVLLATEDQIVSAVAGLPW